MTDLERAAAYLRRRRYRIPAKDMRAVRRRFPFVTHLALFRFMSTEKT